MLVSPSRRKAVVSRFKRLTRQHSSGADQRLTLVRSQALESRRKRKKLLFVCEGSEILRTGLRHTRDQRERTGKDFVEKDRSLPAGLRLEKGKFRPTPGRAEKFAEKQRERLQQVEIENRKVESRKFVLEKTGRELDRRSELRLGGFHPYQAQAHHRCQIFGRREIPGPTEMS